eukprot:scaffold17834_cov101-Cylindrotheca_fusiformis.AAC.1
MNNIEMLSEGSNNYLATINQQPRSRFQPPRSRFCNVANPGTIAGAGIWLTIKSQRRELFLPTVAAATSQLNTRKNLEERRQGGGDAGIGEL